MREREIAKRYLRGIARSDQRIRETMSRIRSLRRDAESLRSLRMNSMPTSARQKGEASFEAAIDRLDEMERNLTGMIDQQQAEASRISDEIASMPNELEAEVLRRLYIEYQHNHSITIVAREMHYSYEYIKQVHRRGLQSFYDIYLSENQR